MIRDPKWEVTWYRRKEAVSEGFRIAPSVSVCRGELHLRRA